LGIDPGYGKDTGTAWAVLKEDVLIDYGTFKTPCHTIQADGIGALINLYSPDGVWIEDQWIGPNKGVALTLARLASFLAGYVYYQTDEHPRLVHPKTWRSVLQFPGKLKTKECKARSLDLWKEYDIDDHNIADAACIALAAYLDDSGLVISEVRP